MSGAEGWIQWKGTDVCMDIHCLCGELTHVDGEFGYYVECSKCGRVYEVDPTVSLTRCRGKTKYVPLREEGE